MKNIIDLSNYTDCTFKLNSLRRAFTAPYNHGAYMPVTRDLSPSKVNMILKWIKYPIYSENYVPINFDYEKYPLDTLHDLQSWLQRAVEMEHATIPVYLSAMYSIKQSAKEKNSYVSNLISSIVVQEMQHMCLAANVLNAIGGMYTAQKIRNFAILHTFT